MTLAHPNRTRGDKLRHFKSLIPVGLLVALALVLSSSNAKAAYYCVTSHGTVTANDLDCAYTRDLVDDAYNFYLYNLPVGAESGFMFDGKVAECYQDPGYLLCVVYPSRGNSWVAFYD